MYLRAYSQKNPLLEYKLEGFQIFDEMLYEIKTAIARKIFRVRIEKAPDAGGRCRPRPPCGLQASHSAMGQFAAGGSRDGRRPPRRSAVATGGIAAPSQPDAAQVQAHRPEGGAQRPCPCGSGKKYKYCHGQ